jgi:DNA-binding NtrC family response regulator
MMSEKPIVLVVDDEPMITTILTAVLQRAGYPVLTASGAREAVEICKAEASIALAIVDYIMPDQNGGDLAASLKKLCPDIRVVMMSGYTGAEITLKNVPCEVHGFLQKPFKVETAVDIVQKALN